MALLKSSVAGSANATVGAGASANRAGAVSPGGSAAGPGGWHPDVLYMLGLVIAEVLVVAWLSRHLLK
jgi:hypothetical protein